MASAPAFMATLFLLLFLAESSPMFRSRRLSALVPSPKLVLDYHGGKLLVGPAPLDVYTIWYGDFTAAQVAAFDDFLSSFSNSAPGPSVSSWWSITSSYKDSSGASISRTVRNAGRITDTAASLGRSLAAADIATLVSAAVARGSFPSNPSSLILVLTAKDVNVDGFCVQSCAWHRSVAANKTEPELSYAWVGDSSVRCPGKCAWPYANPKDFGGPDQEPLVSPNGVAVDGLVVNAATVISGAATNPFSDGYFQGSAAAPLEAVTACPGIFGAGSFPGYPGQLLVDAKTTASYNANGVNGRRFLLPALWDPTTSACAYPSSS